jgi:integrase
VLTDDELQEVWRHAEALGWPFGPFIRALILTGQRRNELAGMTWAEIDLPAREWRIPGIRTKNPRAHMVPIADAFQSILKGAPRLAKDDTGPVFTTNGASPISGFSRPKERLAKMIDEARRKPLPHWTLHDIRCTVGTRMGNLGIQPHIIEAVLKHSGGYRAGVAGVYQRQSYIIERREALQRWAAHVQGVTHDNVVSIRAARLPIR